MELWNLLLTHFKMELGVIAAKMWLHTFKISHKHVILLMQISLTLSHHLSPSTITPGRSSELHPVSTQSCCRLVLASCPTFIRSCEGVYRSTSLMSSFLLFQQCPECFVHLIWMVFVMGGRWPYSCCFVGCCLMGLFNIQAFLYNCRQAFFPYSASIWCIHIAVLIWLLLGKTAFYLIGQVWLPYDQ